ncbi:MAG: acyl-CoA dehydrogenase family protein [Actinomycetota bacterium]
MDAADIELIRKTFESALPAMADDVAAVLAELGWEELHRAEPAVAVAELFEAQGRLLGSTAALDMVVAVATARPLPPGTAVVHPAPGCDEPPGALDSDGQVTFSGLVLARAGRMRELAVPFVTAQGSVGVATASPAAANGRPVAGLDPALRLISVSGTAAAANGRLSGVPRSSGPAAPPGWAAVRQAARRALAHELCGLAQAMLDDAARHVTDRHQFGRPIAAFQTVRHRLTEVYVAIAAARSALDAAWLTDEPMMADAAKALAGRAATLAGRHSLQVTGAIGFTEEHRLPAALRRAGVLDALYGSADQLRAQLGRSLLEKRTVPRFAPLP